MPGGERSGTRAGGEKKAWLFAYALDSVLVSEKRGILGAAEGARRRLSPIQPGDLAVVYAGKEHLDAERRARPVHEFRSLFEVTSQMFESDEPVWPRARPFPLRVRARLIESLRVPLKTLRWDLSFLKGTLNYGLVLLNAPREIPLADIELLRNAAKGKR